MPGIRHLRAGVASVAVAIAVAGMGSLVGGFDASAAQERVGAATLVVQKVTGKIENRKRDLAVKDAVYGDELVSTGAKSAAEFQFLDQTKVTLGPKTELLLDRYVFDPKASTSSVSMNLAKGVFRMVTGPSKFGSYSVKTPTATIGIRGTIVTVAVADNGATVVTMNSDSVALVKSNKVGLCVMMGAPNSSVNIGPDGTVSGGGPAAWATKQINDMAALTGGLD
jgi:hypothetical protein